MEPNQNQHSSAVSASPLPQPTDPPPTHESSPDQLQKAIRTFQNDVAEAIHTKPVSVAQITIAEQSKIGNGQQIIRNEPVQESHVLKNIGVVLLCLILIGMGGAGAYYLYSKSILAGGDNQKIADNPTEHILVPQQIVIVPFTSGIKDFIARLPADAKNLKLPEDAIQEIVITKNPDDPYVYKITSGEFLEILGSAIPSTLKRSLESEFMLGIYMEKFGKPFIILKNNNFQNSFAGLLLWETSMEKDLESLFQSDIGTTTAIFENSRIFEDDIVKNKDVRVLKDEQGTPLIAYTFWDQETIIITTDITALSHIITILEKTIYQRQR